MTGGRGCDYTIAILPLGAGMSRDFNLDPDRAERRIRLTFDPQTCSRELTSNLLGTFKNIDTTDRGVGRAAIAYIAIRHPIRHP